MLTLANKLVSNDGSIKYVLKTEQHHFIESVFFRLDNKTTSNYAFTLCLSSQAGCALNCSFCATGKLGLLENLTLEQMKEQLKVVLKDLHHQQLVNNDEAYHIALMGMGEPLHNYNTICSFYKELRIDSPRLAKISLSTVGLTPKILALADDNNVHYDLFLSLHSPFDTERNNLIPVNKKHPIQQIINACKLYSAKKKELVKISYLLMAGVNDSQKHAQSLASLLCPSHFAVQLLLYNPIVEDPYKRPAYQTAGMFQEVLREKGLDCHIVVSKGLDIMAGCGQLSGQHYAKSPN